MKLLRVEGSLLRAELVPILLQAPDIVEVASDATIGSISAAREILRVWKLLVARNEVPIDPLEVVLELDGRPPRTVSHLLLLLAETTDPIGVSTYDLPSYDRLLRRWLWRKHLLLCLNNPKDQCINPPSAWKVLRRGFNYE